MSESVTQSLNGFAKRLYDEMLIDNGTDKDLIMSPFSISVALSMLYAGCGGNTKEQLKRALFDSYQKDDNQLHANFSEIINTFNADKKAYELHVANRLFPNVHFVQSLLPEYVELLAKCYRSDLKAVDFGKAVEACAEINDWAKEKTRGKIDQVLSPDSVDSNTKLVIINAIYFKGNWLHPFNRSRTMEDAFHQQPNQSIQLNMMSCKDKSFDYYENDHFQLLGMSYEGEDLFMYFFLPIRQCGLAELEKSIRPDTVVKSISECKSTELDAVVIPKFKVESSLCLNEILQRLGMSDMYVQGMADLSNISGGKNLVVSKVIHKAFIEVNEEGAEAAAVTAVEAVFYCAITKNKYINFIANHPFLYVIFHKPSQTILFMGRFSGK